MMNGIKYDDGQLFFLSLALMKKHHLFEKWAQDFLRNDDAGDVAAIPNYASLNRMNIN